MSGAIGYAQFNTLIRLSQDSIRYLVIWTDIFTAILFHPSDRVIKKLVQQDSNLIHKLQSFNTSYASQHRVLTDMEIGDLLRMIRKHQYVEITHVDLRIPNLSGMYFQTIIPERSTETSDSQNLPSLSMHVRKMDISSFNTQLGEIFDISDEAMETMLWDRCSSDNASIKMKLSPLYTLKRYERDLRIKRPYLN